MSDGVFGRGADAIDEALAKLYGDDARCFVGAPEPLAGVRAFRSQLGGRTHWHFVTYGLSELVECDPGDNEGYSSYGFELTARVVEDGDQAPSWVLPVLGGLAQYVFNTGNVFEAGHHIANSGPIHRERPTRLCAFGFVEDPALPTIDTPNGKVSFIQVVGLTADERRVCSSWSGAELLALGKEIDPALLIELERDSWLSRPEARARVLRGLEASGFQVHAQDGGVSFEDGKVALSIDAETLPQVQAVLRGRLINDRWAELHWQGESLSIEPDGTTSVGEEMQLRLDPADRDSLLALPATPGVYTTPSGIVRLEILGG